VKYAEGSCMISESGVVWNYNDWTELAQTCATWRRCTGYADWL